MREYRQRCLYQRIYTNDIFKQDKKQRCLWNDTKSGAEWSGKYQTIAISYFTNSNYYKYRSAEITREPRCETVCLVVPTRNCLSIAHIRPTLLVSRINILSVILHSSFSPLLRVILRIHEHYFALLYFPPLSCKITHLFGAHAKTLDRNETCLL